MWQKLGIECIDNGVQFLRKSFKPYTESKNYGFMKDSLNAAGLTNVVETDMDIRYKVAHWDTWGEILNMVNIILKKIPYLDDYFDCDNYAYFTSSFVPLVFGITCGEAFGKFTNIKTLQQFMHHWNIIIDARGDVHIYDGMSGKTCPVIKGQPIKTDSGIYEIQTVKFF